MSMTNKLAVVILSAAITFALLLLPAISNNIQTISAQSQQTQQQQPPPQEQSQPPKNVSQPQMGVQYIFNDKSKPANAPEECAKLGSVLRAKAIPDYNLCDIVVYRQAPPITRSDGMVLNNFSGFGHYIELVSAVINNTLTFSAVGVSNVTNPQQNNLSVAFGEFALLDSEVVPVREVMQKYNWTETALHHHMLLETPKVLFLHWSVTGVPADIANQALEILMQTSTYQNQTGNTRTPSSAGA
jgi:hypothetical protein